MESSGRRRGAEGTRCLREWEEEGTDGKSEFLTGSTHRVYLNTSWTSMEPLGLLFMTTWFVALPFSLPSILPSSTHPNQHLHMCLTPSLGQKLHEGSFMVSVMVTAVLTFY